MERSAALGPVPAQPFQFTIRSLFWLMVTLGMVLSFVRPADSRQLTIAVASSIIGVVLAAVVGWPTGRIGEAIYWSLLMLALALICLAGQPNVSTEQGLAWPALAIVLGAIAGASRPGKLRLKLPVCAASGTLGMLMIVGWSFSLEDVSDIGLALIVSCVVLLLADLFAWARARYHTSYGAWAAALVLAVILGNWGAEWLTPRLANWLAG